MAHMTFSPNQRSLALSGIVAVLLARTLLSAFGDPVGPNALVVAGFALVILLASLPVYLWKMSIPNKLLLSISLQLLVVGVLYFTLR